MIDFASSSDIEQLKILWKTAFGEGDSEFIDFYFDKFFSTENCIVNKTDDNELTSVIYLFRGTVKNGEKSDKALFIYAAATFPHFRRKGYMHSIIDYMYEYGRKNGYSVCLTVSALDCMNTYEKSGMITCNHLYESEAVAPADTVPEYKLCSLSDFFSMRREMLRGIERSLDWDDKSLEFMYEYINFCGAMLDITVNGKHYYAAVTDDIECLIVRETNAPEEYFNKIAAAVADRLGTNDVIFYTEKPCSSIESSEMYYGHGIMLDGSDMPTCYINLIAE